MNRNMWRVLMLALELCLAATGPAMGAKLKIGSLSPLTGPYAADGNDIANGARAAIV